MKASFLPKVKDEVAKLLESDGIIIRTKAEDDSYIKSQVENEVEVKIKDRIREVHNQYDKDFTEAFGDSKGPHEKTYEFFKRKMADLKKSAGAADPAEKARIEALQTALQEKDAEYQEKIKDLETQHFKSKVSGVVDAALAGVKLAVPAHIKDDEARQKYVERTRTMIKNEFLSSQSAELDKEGNIIFKDSEGTPMVSKKDGSPLGVNDLVSQQFGGFFFTKEQSARGTGSNGSSGEGNAIEFKSREDVHAHVLETGMKAGTPEYNKKVTELITENGVTA